MWLTCVSTSGITFINMGNDIYMKYDEKGNLSICYNYPNIDEKIR